MPLEIETVPFNLIIIIKPFQKKNKRPTLVAAVFHALLNKHLSNIMTNFGRMPVKMRRLLTKTTNNFFQISDFRKNLVYSVNISAQTNDKILIFFFFFQKIRRTKALYESNVN